MQAKRDETERQKVRKKEMICFFSFLIIFFKFSWAQEPILVPRSESAKPARMFDFIYLPKESVVRLLPGFSRRELKKKSEKAAQVLGITPPQDPRAQVFAIQKARRIEMERMDPSGQQKDGITAKLALLKHQLSVIVEQRNRFLSDLKALKTEQSRCSESKPTELQARLRCLAVDDEISTLSRAIKPLNRQERATLKDIFTLRKQLHKL